MNNERNTSAPTLITEVELMNSSPERVYEYLKKQSEKKGKIETDYIDEYTESNLLSRNDKLITLGLALYCLYSKTLSDIFNQAIENDDSVLRLACLSNTTVGRRYSIDALPQALFKRRKKQELLVWFKNAGFEEIDALFKNYTINDGFLKDYLKGNEYWKALDDDRRLQSISSLYYNERMVQRYDDGIMDGFAEYRFNSVFFAVWKLTETVPVNKQWGDALGYLLEKVKDNRFELDSIEVAKRWMVEDYDEKEEEKKQFLNPFEMVRAGLYRDVIKDKYGKNETNKIHYENEDVAYRAVAYAQTNIQIDDITTAYEKDKLLAIEYLMRNLRIWKDEEKRAVLKDICWNADGKYNNNSLDCVNSFNWKQEDLEKKYPDWFKENDCKEHIDEDDLSTTVGMMKNLIQENNYNQSLEILTELLRIRDVTNKIYRNIKWGLIGCIILVLFQFVDRF